MNAMPMPEIQHIVVLMLENRSFDHMVGYMQSPTYQINGIDSASPPTNPMSPQDPTPVTATAVSSEGCAYGQRTITIDSSTADSARASWM